MRIESRSMDPLRREPQNRRALWKGIPLAFVLGVVASACSSAGTSGATGTATPQDSGWELVYRKTTHEPFTSLEVEQIGKVLRARMGRGPGATRVGVMGGEQGTVLVVLPDVHDQTRVDALRPAIEHVGLLTFEGVEDEAAPGWDGQAERKRLQSWLDAHPDASVADYNALPHSAGGPPPDVRWRVMEAQGAFPGAAAVKTYLPCVRADVAHPDQDWAFTGEDLTKVERTVDATGSPAIAFEIRAQRQKAFTAFTASLVDRQLAIVLDGEVISAPTVNAPLGSAAIIQGRFSEDEVSRMLAALRSGPLPVALELVDAHPRPAR